MWCEEINGKYASLHPGTTWYYEVAKHQPVRRFGVSGSQEGFFRPLPWPARDDQKLDLTLQLLNAYYDKPGDFGPNRCGWSNFGTHPIRYPLVRAFILRGLVNPPDGAAASYFRTRSIPPHLAKLLGGLAVKVFTDPAVPESQRRHHEDIIVALAEIVLETGVLDTIAWPWFWVWAQGGTNGDAVFRTRVFALKALIAIVGRGVVGVNAQTISRVEALAASVQNATPPKSYQEEKERQLFASDAAALAAGIASRLASQSLQVPPGFVDPATYTPPGTRPPGTWIVPPWVPVAGGLAAATLAVTAVLAFAKRGPRQR